MRLEELSQQHDFWQRHLGPTPEEQQAMLEGIEAKSLEDLVDQAVPQAIRMSGELELEAGCSETQALRELKALGQRNAQTRSLIGMGYHDTITPTVILRNMLENPGWYTAYTPYQAEISQGRMEMLLYFQQMVMDLTGMDVANASLLDEATAAAEAMTFCQRASRSKSRIFLVSDDCHPQTLDVLRTRSEPLGIELKVGDPRETPQEDVYGVLLQYPGTYGDLHRLGDLIAQWQERGALVAVAADLLALTLLTPPGELGADVVLGSAQRFGVPMGYGGPHAAYFAVRDQHKRSVPGRLIGVSVDRRGKLAYRLALQTREQHIRREKATSNICTAQVLLANVAAAYAIYHGPQGLTTIAQRVHRLTTVLAEGLRELGLSCNTTFFDTLTVEVPDASAVHQRARTAQINLRPISGTRVGVSLDEASTAAEVQALWEVISGNSPEDLSVEQLDARVETEERSGIPRALCRTSEFLTHPVFHRNRSETQMMRLLRTLMDRDIALDRAMIPLGSCTMKLNAATEMLPITWPEFGRVHPFVPQDQAEGYQALIQGLEEMLVRITGFDAVSMQPNSGAQGEYAGLLVIKRYHESRGDSARHICLIPSSAHGTNPASAAMLGMKVVIVECDDQGNVDVEDLRAKAEKHSGQLAALMITYPSTHGVFEESIVEICELIHQHGGQVYMDGANLNALVGLAQPGKFGPDVMHMNLHKTFCIPHGGGGPGMGPIGMKAHLAPFRPSHVVEAPENTNVEQSAVSAAPWGSPSILPISWAYIRLMGAEGLKRASQVAILNANYLASQLRGHFEVLYTGKNGRVAHECIIDLRPFRAHGVTEEDVAKRLIDYGFHAPTMSWPVAGTLMIEPTESEPKAELDRFCEAMRSIREEIDRVASGEWDPEDNPLKNAPHVMDDLVEEHWAHPYSREVAAFPVPGLRQTKVWANVARVDNVYGDRNVVCSCPTVDSYRD